LLLGEDGSRRHSSSDLTSSGRASPSRAAHAALLRTRASVVRRRASCSRASASRSSVSCSGWNMAPDCILAAMVNLLIVGTDKGAFLLRSDTRRAQWTVEGPLFKGWRVTAAARDAQGRTFL